MLTYFVDLFEDCLIVYWTLLGSSKSCDSGTFRVLKYLLSTLPLYTHPCRVILLKQKCCLLLNGVSFQQRVKNVPLLDLHRIMSGFHGTFATGVACQLGKCTLPDTRFRPPFWDLLVLQLSRPDSSSLPCLYSTFHLEYPLVLSRFCSVLQIRRDFYPTRSVTRMYIHVGLVPSYVKLLISSWKIYMCNLMAWYTNK